MDIPNPSETTDVLRSAWKRFAELDATALKLSRQHNNLRLWIFVLGIFATILAVVVDRWFNVDGLNFTSPEGVLRIILVMLPITISVLSAYINKFLGNGEWLTLRAAAEEILKEIFVYRTLLQGHPERAHWLSHRMITIMRRVYKSMSGQLVLEEYNGSLPPYYNPDDPDSDPGFTDLDGAQYLCYRLINQRDWHRKRIAQRQRERKRVQVAILAIGAIGSLFAALENSLVAWVAVTAAIASALTGWEQLRGLDETIMIYSRVNLELTIVRDEWESTPREFRSREDFIRLVRDAEGVLWAQNQKYVATMQDVLAGADGDDAQLVENLIRSGRNPIDVIQDREASSEARYMQQAEDAALGFDDASAGVIAAEIASVIEEGHRHDTISAADYEESLLEAEDLAHEDTLDADIDFETDSIDSMQGIADESDIMREMMANADPVEDLPGLADEVFPGETVEEFEADTEQQINLEEEVQQAIEDVFSPDEENSMIEEALSGFMDDSEDEEVKG